MAFGDFVGPEAGPAGAVGTSTGSATCDVSFTAPSSGNLLIATFGSSVNTASWTTPSGWTLLHDSGTTGNMAGAAYWKISDGTETSVTGTKSGTTGNMAGAVAEYEGPFAGSPLDTSNEDVSNISAVDTSQPSGDISTTQASELLVACFAGDLYTNLDTSRAYSNSFTEAVFSNSGQAARSCTGIAHRTVSSPGTYGTTFSVTDTGDEMYGCIGGFKAVVTGTSPTTVLNSPADGASVADTTPTVEATATDGEGDDVRLQVQIANNSDFASGTNLGDSNARTGDATIHPNPLPAETSPTTGNIQVDDRPGATFKGLGGFLDSVKAYMRRDEVDTDGTMVLRIHNVEGTHPNYKPAGANTGDGGVNTPTSGWIAVSDGRVFDGTMSASTVQYTFSFTGANRIQTVKDTVYMLIFDWIANTAVSSNTVEILWDTGLNDTDGNAWIDGHSANYGVRTDFDGAFEVYEEQTVLTKTSGTDAGFANTVTGGDTDPFNSGEKLGYTVQVGDALTVGRTYYLRARSQDPSGTGAYGDYTASRSFTVTDAPAGDYKPLALLIGVG